MEATPVLPYLPFLYISDGVLCLKTYFHISAEYYFYDNSEVQELIDSKDLNWISGALCWSFFLIRTVR